MKFQFEDSLDFQRDAIDAVCDLFVGQEQSMSSFSVSATRGPAERALPNRDIEMGAGNSLSITDDALLENLQAIQLRNGIVPSESIQSRDFTVEMETGTGKTYVYLRTILELNKRFGFTKFVIVVPSIAVKEGVYKTLQMTRSHFRALYEGQPYSYFPYDSKRMNDVYSFVLSGEIQIMITTVGAINKRDVNNLYREVERGEKPIDLIAATRPILIVDEPQSVDGGLRGAGKQALESMDALATLRYSAIHVDEHHMVYRLNAVDAYQKKLVKQVEVASARLEVNRNSPYLRFLKVKPSKGTIWAEVELEVANSQGVVRRERKWVEDGADLERMTGRSVYSNHSIGEIGGVPGEEYLEYRMVGDEAYLKIGEARGDIDPLLVQRQMIRRTIKEHFDKEMRLTQHGIKVLSLFFIDRVDRYRSYDEHGLAVRGPFAEIFEEEYRRLSKNPAYQSLFHTVDSVHAASDAHDGYFSIDRRGGWTETAANGQGAEAERGYNLIMKEKERLLSFDTPLRFIFSHSALREGWDNPNIFQICALRDVQSEVARRQTIGRGLRLCVNQQGERVRDDQVNVLTVIANESYESFADALQKEVESDTGSKFGTVLPTHFLSVAVDPADPFPVHLGLEGSRELWNFMVAASYLDADGRVRSELREAMAAGSLTLPDWLIPAHGQILQTLERIVRTIVIRDADDARPIPVRESVYLSEEFKELWDRVKTRTVYRLNFDNEILIRDCTHNLRTAPAVGRNRLKWAKAKIEVTDAGVDAVPSKKTASVPLGDSTHGLPDILTELQERTQLTRKSIARILLDSGRLTDFRSNPEHFLTLAADIINRTKRLVIVDGIQYQRLNDDTFEQNLLRSRELRGYVKNLVTDARRSVYMDVLVDSGIERSFAEELESDESVSAFVKLPAWFKIPTPLGSYNPDWAVVTEPAGDDRLYFVVETKGDWFEGQLRGSENAKIACGAAHFKAVAAGGGEVDYVVATSLEDLKIDLAAGI